MVTSRPCVWRSCLLQLLFVGLFGVASTDARTSTNNREFDWTKTIQSIGCFVCTSINHSNPDCEDTFNNTGDFYVPHCWAPRKDRRGVFPGTQCIKIVMQSEGMLMVVRNCVVDNGGTTADTEIGRQSHCGFMRQMIYGDRQVQGCLLACNRDGCNNSLRHGPIVVLVGLLVVLVTCVTNDWLTS